MLVVALALSTPAGAASADSTASAAWTQPESAQPGAAPPREEAQGQAEERKSGSAVDLLARLVNFGILAATLYYLLRSPLRGYLADRSSQIRQDLVNAAEMKTAAATQIEEIDRKMRALPDELETLRSQGAQEIAAEEARILAAAATERDRLVEQAKRDIDLQVKVAERELVAHAANLAVGVASERIKKSITTDDQRRLVDRYVQQLNK